MSEEQIWFRNWLFLSVNWKCGPTSLRGLQRRSQQRCPLNRWVGTWRDQSLTDIPLLTDNGKSFGDPFTNELTILLPLYQCCSVRNSTYQRLRLLSSTRLSEALHRLLSDDILWPLAIEPHFEALDKRLKTVLSVIDVCFDAKGRQSVLKWSTVYWLKKIRTNISRRNHTFGVGNGVKDLWLSSDGIAEGQDCGHIGAPVAVIGCRPYGDKFIVKHVFEALLNELMGATYQLQIVYMNEL